MDVLLSFDKLTAFEAGERLLVAATLGLILGLDREKKDRPLGIRAYMLVCIGGCMFTLLAFGMAIAAAKQPGLAAIDISRVVQGIITGIGFLGAGAIIQTSGDGQIPKGAATGASIWVAGAIGVACGMGGYLLAALATALSAAILIVFGWISNRIGSEQRTDRS